MMITNRIQICKDLWQQIELNVEFTKIYGKAYNLAYSNNIEVYMWRDKKE